MKKAYNKKQIWLSALFASLCVSIGILAPPQPVDAMRANFFYSCSNGQNITVSVSSPGVVQVRCADGAAPTQRSSGEAGQPGVILVALSCGGQVVPQGIVAPDAGNVNEFTCGTSGGRPEATLIVQSEASHATPPRCYRPTVNDADEETAYSPITCNQPSTENLNDLEPGRCYSLRKISSSQQRYQVRQCTNIDSVISSSTSDSTSSSNTQSCSILDNCAERSDSPAAIGECPPGLGAETENDCGIIEKYVNPIINLLAAGAGLIVVIIVIIGGIRYASAGGDPNKVVAAKKMIYNAIFALLGFMFLYAGLQWLVPGGFF